MPIYEYYSPDTNRIYSFYAKTLAQGRTAPRCPDRPGARMVKLLSAFSVGGVRKEESAAAPAPAGDPAEEARIEAALNAMEGEMANVDENDPKAMARLMRRVAEMSGEKLDEPIEEAVRKLEEGADPERLEEQMGGWPGEGEDDASEDGATPPAGAAEARSKRGRSRGKVRRPPASRDPHLYDYD